MFLACSFHSVASSQSSNPSKVTDDFKGALFVSSVSVVNKGLFLYLGMCTTFLGISSR